MTKYDNYDEFTIMHAYSYKIVSKHYNTILFGLLQWVDPSAWLLVLEIETALAADLNEYYP